MDRDKYPTTVGFVERLPKDLRDHLLIKHLSAHFERKFGDRTPDVEKILWCLQELHGHLSDVFNPKHPANWLIPGNNLPSLVGHKGPGHTNEFASVAKTGLGVVENLRSRINSCIYEIYGSQPNESDISGNWGQLLAGLIDRRYWVDVVTTNYDLVIEAAIDLLRLEIGYGQKRGVVPRLDLDVWRNIIREERLPTGSGLVTKLHGSLNWERDGGDVAFSGVQFKSDHKHHAAIYPGFKGVPADSPFDLFHDYFERALQSCEWVIFIGFAFRDEYINDLLRRAPSKQRYVIIDPATLGAVPSSVSARAKHIQKGFGEESVGEVLKLLE